MAALSAALGSPYGVSGAAWLPAEAAARVPGLAGSAVALVRIEDFAASVAYRTDRLAPTCALRPAELLGRRRQPAAVARGAGRDAAAAEPGDAVWRVSVRPSAGPGVLAATGLRGFLDWGGGLVWLAGPPDAHDAVARAATAGGGTWTLVRGPDVDARRRGRGAARTAGARRA